MHPSAMPVFHPAFQNSICFLVSSCCHCCSGFFDLRGNRPASRLAWRKSETRHWLWFPIVVACAAKARVNCDRANLGETAAFQSRLAGCDAVCFTTRRNAQPCNAKQKPLPPCFRNKREVLSFAEWDRKDPSPCGCTSPGSQRLFQNVKDSKIQQKPL